jgi:cytoskeletal protein CcmA (bactofilin family)
MAGYTRQDTNNNIANGNIIDADDIDNEFNALEDAFNASTGHNHDGSPGGGATINSIGPSADLVVTATVVRPKTESQLDVGSGIVPFKDGNFSGTVTAEDVVVNNDVTIAGAVTSTGGFIGPIAGNVTGALYASDGTSQVLDPGTDGTDATFTGDVTGDVQGNILNADSSVILASGTDASPALYVGNVIGDLDGDISGNAGSADVWSTAREITLTGDVTGTVTGVDGSGNISIATTVVNTTLPEGAVTLGVDTSGDYVESATAGTGVTISNTAPLSADGAIYTIEIGQDVSTTSNVQFNKVTAVAVASDIYASDGVTRVLNAGTNGTDASFTGNVTGNFTGSLLGNASTATKLQTGRNIGGVLFDGSQAINLPGVNITGNQDTSGNAATATSSAACTGNAATATKLKTARTIQLSGDVTGSATFDGSGNIVINTSADVGSAANNATITISAGGGMSGGGNFTTDQSFNETISIAHADTSTQPSVNNSGLTFIQDVTLDGYGHVTGINSATVEIPSSTPSASEIGAGTAGLSTGAVGSYAFMNSGSTKLSPGATLSGSSLIYSSVSAYDTAVQAGNVYITRGDTGSGTWRLMGHVKQASFSTYKHSSLWLRIA